MMMMQANRPADPEVTSVAPSSPRSSRHHGYFVQSPSRDSQDGGDSTMLINSTPQYHHHRNNNDDMIGSPLHASPSSLGSFSREPSSRSLASSSSFASSSYNPRINIKPGVSSAQRVQPLLNPFNNSNKKSKKTKAWAAHNTIDEEFEPFPHHPTSLTTSPYIYATLLVLLSCIVFLIFFILLFWLICRPSHPHFSLKHVVFHNFYMGQGLDASGVPTKMVSMNCSVQLDFHNPSKYFGVHVTPLEATVAYSQLRIAKGQISKYFQAKSSERITSIMVQAIRIPIYGAINDISNIDEVNQGIPFTMDVSAHSKYYVVGKMIKAKFMNQASCNLVLDSTNLVLLSPLRASCSYSPPI